MKTERSAYHTLAMLMSGDYRRLSSLIEKHGSWQEALASFPDQERLPHTPIPQDIRLVLRTEKDFPAALREIPFPPHAIYIRGALPHAHTKTIALVGTRKATTEGKHMAHEFAREFAQAGCAVISGLALGIDAAAHDGALEARGYTAAVLATGADRVYPQWNAKLAERILQHHGALISEYPPGSPALPYRFLERNRIVSGLADGVLVIEAPERSGSLATARFALEQNRQILVIPGPAKHPNFIGSHALLRSGAELVTEPTHVLQALGITTEATTRAGETYTDDERAVMEAFVNAQGPLAVDTIIEYTKLNAQAVSRTLSVLVIRGALRESGGGYVTHHP
jgi:DNA processing protein